MVEIICVNCEHEIDADEGFVMVDDKHLCDSTCLAEFLMTHGLVVLNTGRE